MLKQAVEYAEQGYVLIPLKGKKPTSKNWTKADYTFPDDLPGVLGRGNFGVVLSAEDLVLDVDPRNFAPNDNPLIRLGKDLDVDFRKSPAVVKTGSGGLHIYFRIPPGLQVTETLPDYKGLEFKSRGRQVVGAGSVHPDTGREYVWHKGGPKEIADAPKALVERITRSGNGAPNAGAKSLPVMAPDQAASARYAEYLQTAPPAIQGDNGDKTTLQVAMRGRDMGLCQEDTYFAMLDFYNPRCIPSWSEDELLEKVRNAYKYATAPAGNARAEVEFVGVPVPVSAGRHPAFKRWDENDKGALVRTLNNVVNFFICEQEEPLFYESLAYDQFIGQVRLLKPMPWDTEKFPANGREWGDDDTKQMALWLSRERGFNPATELIDNAVLAVSQLKPLHPVRDYLRKLKWDGVPRINTWLPEYAGAQDNVFVRDVSRLTLLQAVARIYQPGCKADHVLVLEGEQGVGKSTLVRILGDPWASDFVVDPHAKDTIDAIRGKWFVEFSEMEVTKRADSQALKAFITKQVDRVRPAYARRAVDIPRQCVFIGTINPDATNEYLADGTGNRRFWPVRIKQVKFQELADVRDQLFAEAVSILEAGAPTHITDKKVLDIARQEQRDRRTTDPYEISIGDWLSEQNSDFVSTRDVWVYALKGTESSLTVAHQRRISQVLKDLGYEHKRKRQGDRVVWGFSKEGAAESVAESVGEMA